MVQACSIAEAVPVKILSSFPILAEPSEQSHRSGLLCRPNIDAGVSAKYLIRREMSLFGGHNARSAAGDLPARRRGRGRIPSASQQVEQRPSTGWFSGNLSGRGVVSRLTRAPAVSPRTHHSTDTQRHLGSKRDRIVGSRNDTGIACWRRIA